MNRLAAPASVDQTRARMLVRTWRRKVLPLDSADDALVTMIARLLADEREACAKIALAACEGLEEETRAAGKKAAGLIRSRERDAATPEARLDRKVVQTFLTLNAEKYFCEHCMARLIGSPLGVVRSTLPALRKLPGFEVAVHWCSACLRRREVTRYSRPEA